MKHATHGPGRRPRAHKRRRALRRAGTPESFLPAELHGSSSQALYLEPHDAHDSAAWLEPKTHEEGCVSGYL